ncbi:expressed unknown protein [Seminavis robusta]|uniref:Uncharacterized protein n=1 Tax=Seminavis robusta TaxID=568900 RepID=A0A9N8DUS3_9STRA|nr:expressed unknown protein [Seminavis robusta]|eukprot:Sro366_g127610.1 n/a (381) ;mRNA; r:29396-30538
MRPSSLYITLLVVLSVLELVYGFVVVVPPPSAVASPRQQSWTLLFASGKKTKKGGMAEKRKRRSQARQQRQQALMEANAQLPASKLDFKTPPPPPTPTAPGGSATVDELEQEATNSKARELVETQRESVNMLTHVTEQLEASSSRLEELSSQEEGYVVLDNLLDESVVQQLQDESMALYEQNEMTADVSQLGTGEFITAIQGGAEQYPKCPRTIEWVVAVTGKLAALCNSQLQDAVELEDRACSRAVARLFDRSSLQASLHLLMGQDSPEAVQHAIQNLKPASLQTVIERDQEDEEDFRKISVCYFLTDPTWNEACGGHLTFATGSTTEDATTTTIEALRNRLVIWRSDTTRVRREPFRGSEILTTASTIELHLVQKQQG